ncbi:MAG: Scaffold-type E3 ligase [Alectoria sarmentosa]|nr:MAG: Scaffold-type E3 ligase [Alectoria sarmentosa]
MLTADEQWRIIQQEERRTGRGRRKKKKSFMEQLEDMGGFGYDPDSEQAIREDLERTDTRSPMQYSKESISECEVSFGESSFWESRKRLFNSWVFQANRSSSWMEKKDLPLFFRFALRRPIMDERSFQATLHAMNMQLEIAMGDVRQPNTQPIGRFRELIFGIDVDHKTDIHVSSKFRHILPKGGAENMDKVKEGVTKMSEQDDEDKQQLVRRQLWAVYEHVQNSSVPLETAIWHYRDVFSTPDMSDETLIVCLQQFGIPTDHIPTNERNARRGSAHCPFSSGLESFREEIANNAVPNEKERRIIKELVNYIGLYRGGALQEHEVIPMIQHGLDGLGLEANVISDILTDFDKDEEAAALLMWEDACYNIDTTSSEEESEGSHEEQEKPLRAIFIPHPHVNEGKDHEAAVAPHVDGSKLHDGPATEDLNYQDDFKENGPEQSEAMSIDRPLMSPPAIPRGKRLTSSHVNDAESSIQPPGTPRPKPASPAPATEDFGSRSDVEFDREPPRDRANAGGRRLSSPENGMTTGIWGLLMPTREARELAYRMKLPQDTIDQQVRSILPRRTKSRRASYAKTVVIFPKSKCKASTVLHGANPPKSPKHGDHSDLFATEGEDQETFVLSHFDRYSIHSEDTCMRCLRLLCECVHGSSPHLRSEPECPECLRQPCICSHLPQPDEAIPVVPSNGNPSFGVPMAESADRTRRKPLKQSITLLAYLTRVLDNDDVLASIKHLERLSPADRTVADAKAILDHTYQGIYAGEELDITGNDDREAVRILDALVQSSQTLTDYSHELHSDQKGENDSITSVDGCHDEVGEGPDLGSSLLNSSPGHEKISAPRSNSVASATDFPKSQSNVANGSVFRANSTPLAEELSSYLPTPPPDSSFPPLEFSSDIEDVVQPSHFQASIFSDSSARGDPSRAENYSDAQAGGESSTARGHPSGAELQNPPSSTADLNEQVSEHPVGTEVDTDCDTLGAPLTGQPNSGLWGTGNSGVETRPPPSPRPGAKQFPSSIPLPSSRPPLKGFPKSTPPATPSLGSKVSKTMNAIAKTCLESPGFDSLPLWPAQPGLPEKGGMEWMSMTPKQALEHAKEEAFNQRKSLAFYLEERRAVRNRIKKENNFANSKWSDYSFFQSSHGLSGSSGTAIVPALNKLFDKYRDNVAGEPDKIGIEGSMRYLMDLGLKLDEAVVLAVLTELGAPTMGEFTRDGFVSGWQNHRAETLPKQQSQIASFRRSLAMTPDFFKRVYKQTFLIARLPGQKIVPLETALEYWRLLFTAPSLSWNTANTPWLTLWLEYLEAQWKKSVSKDMWDQTGVFAMKSLEDENMSWWSEDGAWPGVLDEFVFYVREKRRDAAGGAESEMDVG